MEQQATQAALAREVEAVRAEAALQREAETRATVDKIRTLELEECADATLDPALRDILGGL